MKTALAENPFLPDPRERGGDYRGGQRVNCPIGKGTIDQGPIDQGTKDPLDHGTNAPLNYSQSNSGGAMEPIEPIDKLPIEPLPMEPLAIEPKDQETWEQLKGIIAKCKKNFEENKEKWEEMAPDPSQRFPTEEKLPNGNTWLIDPQTGEKWGLLYKDPRDGLEYVKHIKWEGKKLTARERELYHR